jgi:hypothetical protein
MPQPELSGATRHPLPPARPNPVLAEVAELVARHAELEKLAAQRNLLAIRAEAEHRATGVELTQVRLRLAQLTGYRP